MMLHYYAAFVIFVGVPFTQGTQNVPFCPPKLPDSKLIAAILRTTTPCSSSNEITPEPNCQILNTTSCQLQNCNLDPTTCTTSLSHTKLDPENCNEFTPDLLDCRNFFYCHQNVFYKYVCVNGTYDPRSQTCSSATCNIYNEKSLCENKKGEMVDFIGDKGKYVLCSEIPQLLDCEIETEMGSRFNSEKQKCEVFCTQEGYFEDSKSPDLYYSCVKTEGVLKISHKKCAPGKLFDSSLGICKVPKVGGDVCSNSTAVNSLCEFRGNYAPGDPKLIGQYYKDIKLFCEENGEPGQYFYTCGASSSANCQQAKLVQQTIIPGCRIKRCLDFYWVFDCT